MWRDVHRNASCNEWKQADFTADALSGGYAACDKCRQASFTADVISDRINTADIPGILREE